jgi:hypothetical protein
MSKKLPLLAAFIAIAAAGFAGSSFSKARAATQSESPEFTTASLSGTCGFNSASTVVNPLSPAFLHPVSSYGTLLFDGSGTVTSTITINLSGNLIPATTFVGSYSVGSDGRTGTLDFSAHGGNIYQFVITAGATRIRYINTGPVDPTTGIVDAVIIGNCKF